MKYTQQEIRELRFAFRKFHRVGFDHDKLSAREILNQMVLSKRPHQIVYNLIDHWAAEDTVRGVGRLEPLALRFQQFLKEETGEEVSL